MPTERSARCWSSSKSISRNSAHRPFHHTRRTRRSYSAWRVEIDSVYQAQHFPQRRYEPRKRTSQIATLGLCSKSYGYDACTNTFLLPRDAWRLQLLPRDAALARWVQRVELDGDRYLRAVRLQEGSGDQTQIKLANHTTALRASSAEFAAAAASASSA